MTHKTRKLHPSLLPVCLCFLLVFLLPNRVLAADADNALNQAPVVVNLKQFKIITDAKGEQRHVDASLVLPGDVIEYQATYTNRSTAPLNVTATLPVPEAVEYLKDSAKSTPALAHTVALKDNQFGKEPLSRRVSAPGGGTVLQQVPYAEYRLVRWDLGQMAPGASAEVRIRAQVSQNLPAEGSAASKVTSEPAAKK